MKSRNLIALSTLAISLLAMSPNTILAKRTPAQQQEGRQIQIAELTQGDHWKRQFNGTPSFRLADDNRLRELDRNVEQRKSNLREVTRSIRPLEEKLSSLNESIKRKNQKISELARLNQDVANEVLNKTQRKNTLQSEIASTQSKIDQKSTEISNAQTTLDLVRTGAEQAVQAFEDKKQECIATPSDQCKVEQRALKKSMREAQDALKSAQAAVSTIQKEVQSLRKNIKDKREKVQELNKFLSNINGTIQKRNQQIAELQGEVKINKSDINNITNQLRPLKQKRNNISNKLNASINNRNNYRADLINTILEANSSAVRMASVHGADDGLDLARRLGNNEGNLDGDYDGEVDGTRDGKARQYQIGYNQGHIDGQARGDIEGESKGTIAGRIQGNKDAAIVAGRTDGTIRANKSDASAVGQAQGKRDGLDRADREGNKTGTRIGQEEAIKNNESSPLSKTTISGDFAGAFSRRVPTYPWGYEGNLFNSSTWNYNRSVVRRAYTDGYLSQYEASAKRNFDRNISNIYNNAYDSSYDFAYNDFYNLDYPTSRKNGYDKGEGDGFDRRFPIVYNQFFSSLRDQYAKSPNTSSTEYKSQYATTELSTYNRVYENIRSEQYNIFELETFNKNIDAKTEHYKKIRVSQVDQLYSSYPVLKFTSSTIADSGISGVAANDGIYQPGESIIHNISVTNYGSAPATNVIVTTDDGKEMKLPTIAGKTTLSVQGAATQSISTSAKVGTELSKAFRVNAPLTATTDAAIQGRHFRNRAQGILALDVKKVNVSYPFALSGLSLNKSLVLDDIGKLSLSVSNRSNRTYTGPLKIELDVNSYGNIIKKNFDAIQNIDGTISISDAEVLVKEHKDAYRGVNFTAKIVKDGVTLGFLDRPLSTMVKAPYKSRPGKPIVVVDSNKSTSKLLDLLAVSGGIESVAILDTSLTKRNAVVLGASFQNMTVLFIGGGNAARSINNMLKRSKNSAIITVDGTANGFEELAAQSAFSNGIRLPMYYKGLGAVTTMSTNKVMMGSALADDIFVIKASTKYHKSYFEISGNLRISEDALLKKITTSKYFKPGTFLRTTGSALRLGQVANARMAYEILRVDKATKANKSKWSEDLVFSNSSSLINTLVARASNYKGINSSNIGLYLFAMESKYGLKQGIGYNSYKGYSSLSKIKSGIKNKVSGGLFIGNYVFKKIDGKVEGAIRKFDRRVISGIKAREGYYNAFPHPEGKNSSNIK